ncbi:MAG: PQQ-binding-like beta-propeller repeat protein [Acidobacteriota bacterium]
MKPRNPLLWVSLAILGLALAVPAVAETDSQDWPQFRGQYRDGVSRESGLLDSWPEGGPKERWRTPLGEGYSGISVVGDRLYTMYAEAPPAVETKPAASNEESTDGETAQASEAGEPKQTTEYAAAYDAANGKQLWRTPIGTRITTEFGNGPRSTPTVDGDSVYVLGAHGELAALATEDGAKRWQITLEEEFGTKLPYWGFSTSTLVEGDLLVIESGGAEGKSYAGLDKATGKVQWTTGEATSAGYSSPLAVTMDGERHFIYVTNSVLRAIDTAGNEVWSHPWPSGETHAMPIFIPPDKVFASGAEGVGAALVQIKKDGNEISVEELWTNRVMRNHFSTSIVHDGHIYGFDNATLKCISVETGEQQWAKRGFGKGSLIYADGHLLVLSDRGRLVQIEATSEGYKEKGRIQALEGLSWTAPTLAGGKLYLRNQTEMASYDLAG